MIEAKDISKSFEKIKAIDNISISIEDRHVFGLIGTNGAGKSTLMRMLSGVLKADRGSVLIDGEPVYDNPSAKRQLFYISDDQFFFNNSNMEDMARYYAVIYPRFSYDKFHRLTELFRLDSKRNLNTFSKGMQKQAHIILALACEPDYLFCDETFDGLDPVMRQAVKRLLADAVVEQQLTPIIASHNLRELEDICDHIGLLHQGGIVFERELDGLQSNIQKVQCAFSTAKGIEDFSGLDVVTMEQRGNLSILVVRGEKSDIEAYMKKMNPLYCELLPLSLEEIFITEMEVLGYDIQQLIY